jgi:hypothetical protein
MPSNKTNLLNPEKLHIANTAIVKCHIDSPFDFKADKVKGYEFGLGFEMGFNLEDKLVKADFKLEVSTKSEGENPEEAKGSFHMVFVFQVENLEELAIPDKNYNIELNGGLGNALASITYSTTRGILFARLKGTALENFVLPVIDPNKLLENKNINGEPDQPKSK